MNKLLSCRYNMDTNRVEAQFADSSAVAIDCIAIEDEYGNTPAQRAELDWLLYNKPLESGKAGFHPCQAEGAARRPAEQTGRVDPESFGDGDPAGRCFGSSL